MSGTSLDGLDVAFCEIIFKENQWNFNIVKAKTYQYSNVWKETLKSLENSDALNLALIDREYGFYLGKIVNQFISEFELKPDFIASHGHTIFHQPEKKFTFQIGNGAAIAAENGIDVICDFRTMDVSLGGQGAPLVPIGDQHLFSDFNFCLNLGGFANISIKENGNIHAFDVCPVSIVLNNLVSELGLDFDESGAIARKGKCSIQILQALDALEFYNKPYPKSLGKEWVLENVFPVFMESNLPVEDKLRTFCEHASNQIAKAINFKQNEKVLVTGGGAFNEFLIELIQDKTKNIITIPDKLIVDFKEALIFAFLGVLRIRNEVNCLKSVTGAKCDNIGGAIYKGNLDSI